MIRLRMLPKAVSLLVFHISILLQLQLTQGKYGTGCKGVNGLDAEAALSCINGTWQCALPTKMVFDWNQSKCLALPGEMCSYTSKETGNQSLIKLKLGCVNNEKCNLDGKCAFSNSANDYFTNSKNECIPKGLDGANCTASNECREDLLLSCSNGFCSCPKNEAVYNTTIKKCVGLIGASCKTYNICTEGALCAPSVVVGRNLTLFTCACKPEYVQSLTGTCVSNYGMSCHSKWNKCREDFACIEGTCHCHYPFHQYYDQALQKCVSRTQGPCSELRNGKVVEYACTPNAHCVHAKMTPYMELAWGKIGKTAVKECVCKNGYVEAEGRKCKIKFGQPCEGANSCDSLAGLQCYEGICSCRDFQQYNHGKQRCQSMVMSECSKGSCGEFAYCDAFKFQSYKGARQGVCRCHEGYHVTANRGCGSVLA